MDPLFRATPIPFTDAQVDEHVKRGLKLGKSREEVIQILNDTQSEEIWKNDIYTVHVRGRGTEMIHLSIRRNDRAPAKDWRHFQEIKNQLVGPENEGLELYPSESRVVDMANQYHLWILADPRAKIAAGFENGGRDSENVGGSVQRPIGES